jgi:hypothetical protein
VTPEKEAHSSRSGLALKQTLKEAIRHQYAAESGKESSFVAEIVP